MKRLLQFFAISISVFLVCSCNGTSNSTTNGANDNNAVQSYIINNTITAKAGTTVSVPITFIDEQTGSYAKDLQIQSTKLPQQIKLKNLCLGKQITHGNGCQVRVEYTAGIADNGSFKLPYSYIVNNGQLQSGSIELKYQSTPDSNLVITEMMPGKRYGRIGHNTQIHYFLTTDDGCPATNVRLHVLNQDSEFIINNYNKDRAGNLFDMVSSAHPGLFNVTFRGNKDSKAGDKKLQFAFSYTPGDCSAQSIKTTNAVKSLTAKSATNTTKMTGTLTQLAGLDGSIEVNAVANPGGPFFVPINSAEIVNFTFYASAGTLSDFLINAITYGGEDPNII